MRVSARVGFRRCVRHLRGDHTLQGQDARNVTRQNGRVADRQLFWISGRKLGHPTGSCMNASVLCHPAGLLFVPTYPALKRWAKLFASSGARFTRAGGLPFVPSIQYN